MVSLVEEHMKYFFQRVHSSKQQLQLQQLLLEQFCLKNPFQVFFDVFLLFLEALQILQCLTFPS
jgi:hypothetical protein